MENWNQSKCEIQPVSFLVKKTDREPPTTTLVSNPPRYTNQKTVQFRWKGNDPQTPVEELTYSFRLNNDPWSPYTAETAKVLYIQQDGEYVFSVRTKDSYGNVDPTPPTYILRLIQFLPLFKSIHFQIQFTQIPSKLKDIRNLDAR